MTLSVILSRLLSYSVLTLNDFAARLRVIVSNSL